MKRLIVLASLITMISAQRPSFAGSKPIGIPDLASRFKTEAPASASGTNSANGVDVANRLGDGDKSTTPSIPIEANGDADLVNRVKTWPRENQPFWYINQQHVDKHLNRPVANSGTGTVQGKQPTQTTITRSGLDGKQEIPESIANNKDLKVVETEQPFDGTINGKKPVYVEKVVYRYYYD